MSNPYEITKTFERALCDYTGAKHAVAVNSCTAALLLSVQWCVALLPHGGYFRTAIEIPRRTYVSVPCTIILAGCKIEWRDEDWRGAYQLKRLPIWDSARRFTSGIYRPGQFHCVSFSTSKILGDEQGGAILHDNEKADSWFRRMRFDGRTEGVDPLEDTFDLVGMHCIMTPSVSARLLLKLHHLPKHNEDLPHYDYPDLSTATAFK